jgi:hypothetical protein
LLQTSLVRGAEYAVGIAALVSGPTGVDQQRLPRWSHDKRCLSAFYIDEVDLQRLIRVRCSPNLDEYYEAQRQNSC